MLHARPSDNIFYKHFLNDMSRSEGKDIGADIACQHMMHFNLFKTKHVLCVDKKKEVFEGFEHLEREGRATFLVDDITNLKIPPSSVDFVVSTHTLSHLSENHRSDAVKNLISILKPAGDLIFNIPRSQKNDEYEMEEILSSNFKKYRRICYRNFISDIYEKWIADENGRVRFPKNSSGKIMLMKFMSKMLAVTDYIPVKRYWSYYFAEKKI